MKKALKAAAGVAVLATLSVGAIGLSACTDSKESSRVGVAYALTHTDGSYISKATVTATEGDITAATLVEVETPTSFSFDALDNVPEEDKVASEVTSHGTTSTKYFYKTVKYGNVEMTFDAEAKTYKVGTQTMLDYFRSEDNCKAYYEAVVSNSVAVMAGGNEDKTVICNNTANKEENGYWTTSKKDENGDSIANSDYSRWKVNRDATVEFVIDNDTAAFGTLTKSETSVKDSYGADALYWYLGTVNTGATWTDMTITDSTRAATGYIQLLASAYKDAGFTL